MVTYFEELSGVFVGIIDADCSSMDTNVKTNSKVLRHKGTQTISFENHLTVKESTLGNARVRLLGLNVHNRLVFQEVVNKDVVNSVVFKTAFYNAFFEVTVKAEDLNYN